MKKNIFTIILVALLITISCNYSTPVSPNNSSCDLNRVSRMVQSICCIEICTNKKYPQEYYKRCATWIANDNSCDASATIILLNNYSNCNCN